jgi:hypothetical protein
VKPGEIEGYPLNPTFSLLRARLVGQCPTLGKGRGDVGGPPPTPSDLLRRPNDSTPFDPSFDGTQDRLCS